MEKQVILNNLDISTIALNFAFGTNKIELAKNEYLFFNAYKRFKRIHVELTKAFEDPLFIKYWDGVLWKELPCRDYTHGFTRSGFIEFEHPSDWTLYNNFYSIQFSFDVETKTNGELKGIGFLFSNDDDLRGELLCYDQFLQKIGVTSLISFHQAARTQILDEINRSGKFKNKNNIPSRIDDLDFLIPVELQQASKYLALAKLFFELSDNKDDKYYQKYKDYLTMYESAKNVYFLTLDFNDDGIINTNERMKIRSITVNRL